MKWKKPLWITLILTAGLLALAIGSRELYAPMAADYWRGQLDSLPDGRAESVLRNVAGLGESGIPVLAEALGSDREVVARAAKRTIVARLDYWQDYPHRENLRLQSLLADALASRIEVFGPTARADAVELVTKILSNLPDRATDYRSQTIGACELVFRDVGIQRGPGPEQDIAQPSVPITREDTLVRRSLPRDLPRPSSAPAESSSDGSLSHNRPVLPDSARIPGGRLLPDYSILPRYRSNRIEVSRATEIPPLPPGIFLPPSNPESVNPLRQPARAFRVPEPSLDPRQPAPRLGREPSSGPSPITLMDWDSREPRTQEQPPGGLREVATIELMRSLDVRDGRVQISARAELVRRGFTAEHIDLAHRLFDPNPETRRRLVGRLAEVRSVNATPWLMHLASDTHVEVRWTALSMLATATDRAILQDVGRMARADPDPRIRRIAERLEPTLY